MQTTIIINKIQLEMIKIKIKRLYYYLSYDDDDEAILKRDCIISGLD